MVAYPSNSPPPPAPAGPKVSAVIRAVSVITLLCLAGLPILVLVSGATFPIAVTATILALLSLTVLDWVVARHVGVSPLRVYMLIAGATLLAGLGVYGLTFLGPAGALALTLFVSALAVALTLLRRPHLRRLREDTGLCPECGYDLRATADRCPECNTPIPDSLARRRRVAALLRAARHQPTASPLPAAAPPQAPHC
jgi:hypothetical protein